MKYVDKIQISYFLHQILTKQKGLFTNYVGRILAFFDHLPPCVDIFSGHFWTTYLPCLLKIHLIIEADLDSINRTLNRIIWLKPATYERIIIVSFYFWFLSLINNPKKLSPCNSYDMDVLKKIKAKPMKFC